MKNVLVILIEPEKDVDSTVMALIPESKLAGYDLGKMHGMIVGSEHTKMSPEVEESIKELFYRTGIVDSSMIAVDFQRYLYPKYPFTVDNVVVIGWTTPYEPLYSH